MYFSIVFVNFVFHFFQVHQFEKDLEKLRTRQKTEMEQKLKQMSADEKRLLRHIKDKHDNDMKMFLSDQKAAYKAAKNQFKKVCSPALTSTRVDVKFSFLSTKWSRLFISEVMTWVHVIAFCRTRDLTLLLPIIGHILYLCFQPIKVRVLSSIAGPGQPFILSRKEKLVTCRPGKCSARKDA